ncbi:hypothetical protein [Flavonifractor plautii]|jgi:hypothetical protein|uniref:hypothetical protein n=1 Tax=Flavonifractor plautii TaxID=292800 RepID=UPI003D7D0A4A
MKIPAEFEDILRGVELTEREKRFLRWITSWDDHTMQNMRTVVEKVRSTLSTLQAENGKLRAELKSKVDLVFQQAKELDRRHLLLQEQEADLEQVKRERDELERFLGELEGAVYTGQYFHLRSMIEKWRGQKED